MGRRICMKLENFSLSVMFFPCNGSLLLGDSGHIFAATAKLATANPILSIFGGHTIIQKLSINRSKGHFAGNHEFSPRNRDFLEFYPETQWTAGSRHLLAKVRVYNDAGQAGEDIWSFRRIWRIRNSKGWRLGHFEPQRIQVGVDIYRDVDKYFFWLARNFGNMPGTLLVR